jgi:CheY-like chemotaxis protein
MAIDFMLFLSYITRSLMRIKNMHHPNNPDSPFHFFERLIRILVVDATAESPAILQGLQSYRPYFVTHVSNAKNALELLSSEKRFHVCLCDLGLFDLTDDKFNLLKTVSSELPIIVMTDENSYEQGFKIGNLGAFAAVKRPIDFKQQGIIDLINEGFIQSIFRKRECKNYKPIILDAIKAFIEFKPMRVKEWVEKLGIEERYLRRVWMDSFGYQPRFIILLYKLLLDAFKHFNNLYFKEGYSCSQLPSYGDCVGFNLDDENFEFRNQRYFSLFEKHHSKLEAILKG